MSVDRRAIHSNLEAKNINLERFFSKKEKEKEGDVDGTTQHTPPPSWGGTLLPMRLDTRVVTDLLPPSQQKAESHLSPDLPPQRRRRRER